MIVFLDFDGVLHPLFPLADLPDDENQYFSYLANFEAVLRQVPEAEIVIASTWRETRSLEELKAFFSPDIATRIIGKNPKIPGCSGKEDGDRQRECEAWLESMGRTGEAWVGVDDVVYLYQPGASVVRTLDGFRAREQEALLEALKNPTQWAVSNPVPVSFGLQESKPRVGG